MTEKKKTLRLSGTPRQTEAGIGDAPPRTPKSHKPWSRTAHQSAARTPQKAAPRQQNAAATVQAHAPWRKDEPREAWQRPEPAWAPRNTDAPPRDRRNDRGASPHSARDNRRDDSRDRTPYAARHERNAEGTFQDRRPREDGRPPRDNAQRSWEKRPAYGANPHARTDETRRPYRGDDRRGGDSSARRDDTSRDNRGSDSRPPRPSYGDQRPAYGDKRPTYGGAPSRSESPRRRNHDEPRSDARRDDSRGRGEWQRDDRSSTARPPQDGARFNRDAPRESRYSRDGNSERTPQQKTYAPRTSERGAPRDNRYGKDSYSKERSAPRQGTRDGSYAPRDRAEAPREQGPRRPPLSPAYVSPKDDAPTLSRSQRNSERDSVPLDHPDGVRISKLLAERGLCSRREADEYIERGWVLVNGTKVARLGSRALPTDEITLAPDAQKQQARRVTILLHKPVGYVSGQPEPGHQPAIVLIKPENQLAQDGDPEFSALHLRELAPAGRLDIDSTGLLVLTQDGRIARTLIGEESTTDKEYLVRVEGTLSDEGLALLRHGLSLDGEPLKPAQVEWVNEDQLRFVLHEGKKRQIRRMCEAVGLTITGLKRVRIGQVRLSDLPMGQWRYLRDDESFA